MKVVFFGSSGFVIPVLNALYHKQDLQLVVTTEQGIQDPVKFFCNSKKIHCVTVKRSGELMVNYNIQRARADIGVVADFGIIIPELMLRAFPKGVINIHPSLLPKYRGPTPVQTAILNKEKETGVSIIQLDNLIDHGPIYSQITNTIEKNDTAKSLYEKLFKQSANLTIEVLQKIEHNAIKPMPQDDTQATLTKFLTREDGYINPGELKIENWQPKIEPMIHAFYPWPGLWTQLRLSFDGQTKIIKFLPENKIQVEGGKEMAHKDFINGYPTADSALLELLRKASPND